MTPVQRTLGVLLAVQRSERLRDECPLELSSGGDPEIARGGGARWPKDRILFQGYDRSLDRVGYCYHITDGTQ